MPSKEAEGLLLAALNSNVQALWFSFGNNLGKWVQFVRDNTSEGKKPPLIFIQVNSLEEAVYYVNNLKPDVIVAQGTCKAEYRFIASACF